MLHITWDLHPDQSSPTEEEGSRDKNCLLLWHHNFLTIKLSLRNTFIVMKFKGYEEKIMYLGEKKKRIYSVLGKKKLLLSLRADTASALKNIPVLSLHKHQLMPSSQ